MLLKLEKYDDLLHRRNISTGLRFCDCHQHVSDKQHCHMGSKSNIGKSLILGTEVQETLADFEEDLDVPALSIILLKFAWNW